MSPRVVVVADSHFSPRTPVAEQNARAVLRHVGAVEPDLVIRTGDVPFGGTAQSTLGTDIPSPYEPVVGETTT